MIEFSDYLQDLMNRYSVSASELSEETGIDRTVVYRYMKGKRVPSSVAVVEKLADALQISEKERKRLLQEYDKAILGESMVFSYQYIQKMLLDLDSLNENIFVEKTSWSTTIEMRTENNFVCLHSQEEIITCILDLFRHAAYFDDSTEDLVVIMQPTYEDVQRFIPSIFKDKSMKVRQLICMEQNSRKDYKNLILLNNVLQPCFFLPNYEAVYYYDDLHAHINGMSFMPNIIIARDYVIQFDYKMEEGTVFQSREYAQVVRRQAERMFAESRSLLEKGQVSDMMENLLGTLKGRDAVSLSCQPCMGKCLDKSITQKHMRAFPGKDEFIASLFDVHGEWSEESYEESAPMRKAVSYGSIRGLNEFMRTGIIDEFPKTLYTPLAPAERLTVLKRMIELMQRGIIQYYFISDEIPLPTHVECYADVKSKQFLISKVSDGTILQLAINEKSLYNAFFAYLEYLDKKGLICSFEESLACMQKLYEKYL